MLKRVSLMIAGLLVGLSAVAAPLDVDTFSFHILLEPTILDPQLTSSASGNYLLYNMYRGLLRYTDDKGLVGEGAKSCKRHGSRQVICELRSGRKWSNGEPITASDYVASFRRLIDPEVASPQSDVLFTVKNAMAIWRKEKKPEELGVFADSPSTLRIDLETDDFEFEYKLIHPALSPLPPGGYMERPKAEAQVVSGPYSISEWKTNSWIKLKNNPHFDSVKRPPVLLYFVDEDATATRLYEAGKMTFLRRVTAADLLRLRKLKGFHQIPVARFDYIGFGPKLADQPEVRKALVQSVDHKMFLKLFDTLSRPGCPGIPAKWLDKVPCQEFSPSSAKAAWDSVSNKPKLALHVSLMGGDDIARAAEWLQGQWKKNLGAIVEVKSQEQAVYLHTLKADPPPIFRKGVSLDRPTCLAGLELFTKNHPDNYIRLDDPKYEELVHKVAKASTEPDRKIACRKALEFLLSTNRMIPLGEIKFFIMASTKFSGWSLNSLNQLDLSGLNFLPIGPIESN